MPLNEGMVTLERAEVQVPGRVGEIVPFHAGETLRWRFLDPPRDGEGDHAA
jgi:dihydroorotase